MPEQESNIESQENRTNNIHETLTRLVELIGKEPLSNEELQELAKKFSGSDELAGIAGNLNILGAEIDKINKKYSKHPYG